MCRKLVQYFSLMVDIEHTAITGVECNITMPFSDTACNVYVPVT